ncbi:MAG: ATP-binding cassette domain-containing protein [Chloroflexota bacterium]
MSDSIITCDGLVKIYKINDIEVLALQGLELTVRRGEMVGVVGASGSGKTTLMNVLGGLIRPSAGKVEVNGKNLLKLSDRALDRYRRTEVGFVWQQGARNLIPYLTAVENIEFPMTLAGSGGKNAKAYARELLDMVGLSERSDHYIQMLSGGEQQRVAIAVALANKPSILLADEPTGELDSNTALTIYDMFRKLNEALNLTIIIVSHDPNIAKHVDRVVAIRDGKTAAETVRAKPRPAPSDESEAVSEEEIFEELTVLDSAGRLQVPKEYREALQMSDRVRLEITDDGVLIKPVEQTAVSPQSEAQVETPAQPTKQSWRDRLFSKK